MSESAVLFVVAALLFATSLSATAEETPVRFSKPEAIRYDRQCFSINGKDTFVFSGEFHYFRCPKELWADRLLKFKRAGFNAVDIYIPWNWHEQVEGRPDMRDLDDLLTLCERMGLMVIARPGPYICAEWDIGGFPRWLPPKRVGFRSSSEASKKWSDHWYASVMPVVAKHQITKGGSVILVQLENEYSYSGQSDADMADYIRSLYESARKHGIEVPMITCWTPVVRHNDDPVMSQIMDTCNFYPGWDFVGPRDALAQLRREEPFSPLMVTELQGGWFSTFGGIAPDKQPFSPAQINALTKTVYACGLTASNYYMLFGGTNFGYWGAKSITTTYDYQAPIAEPGGLWDKYYAVKLIGDFIRIWGGILVRAEQLDRGASADAEGITVWERTNGAAGFIFVRNDTDQWKSCSVSYIDPATGKKSENPLSLPLAPRDMKILPVNLPIPGGVLRSCAAEVQSAVRVGDRTVLVVYSDPDPKGEHAAELSVEFNRQSVTVPIKITAGADLVREAAPGLVVVVTDRGRAGRTWSIPARRSDTLLVSNAYLVGDWESSGRSCSIELKTLPGELSGTLIAPSKPSEVRLNGKPVDFSWSEETGSGRIAFKTPELPAKPVAISSVKGASDPVESGTWRKTELKPLEEMGIYDNGYVRYRASFQNTGIGRMTVSLHAPNQALVFLNGKLVKEALGDSQRRSFDARPYLRTGRNSIEILTENPGRHNGGAAMEELRGLASVEFRQGSEADLTLSKWRAVKSSEPGKSPAEAAMDFDDSSWQEVEAGNGPQELMNGYVGWAWFRTSFDLKAEALPHASLHFGGVDDNCIVYVNGTEVARHNGWDEAFGVDDIGRLLKQGKNVLAVAVYNQAGVGGIYAPVTLKASDAPAGKIEGWELAIGMAGQESGWTKAEFDDSGWKSVVLEPTKPAGKIEDVRSSDAVKWYRFSFPTEEVGGWDIPFKLRIAADGDGLIYVNGRHLGRCSDRGPQTEFYLPSSWLESNGEENTVAIMLRPSARAAGLYGAEVLPYEQFSVRRNKLQITF